MIFTDFYYILLIYWNILNTLYYNYMKYQLQRNRFWIAPDSAY